MKKRIVQSLLLLGMMVFLSVPLKGDSVAPKGVEEIIQNENIEEEKEVCAYAGITKTMGDTITNSVNKQKLINIRVKPLFIPCVSKEHIQNESQCVEYDVPNNNGFKSFMPYTAITSKESKQYKLQKEYAYTGEYGIRKVDDRYCVAIGTAFNSQIGDYADLVLKNGTIIPVIISDIKADEHTDTNNIATSSNGCVSEFVVDTNVLDKNIEKHGDVSSAKEEWDSEVVVIKVYEKNVFN